MLKATSSESHSAEKAVYYRFEEFEFNGRDNSLSAQGKPVALAPKPSQFLGLLLAHSGQVVSNDQIIEHIWGGSIVDYQQNLHYTAKMVRKALADEASAPKFIETIPRKGYRFIGKPIIQNSQNRHKVSILGRRKYGVLSLSAIALLLIGLVYMNFENPQLTKDRKWLNATHLLSQKNPESWQQGLILTAQLVDQYPQNAKAHALHAKALFTNQKDTTLIKTAIDNAITLDENEASAWRESGLWKLYHLQQPQQAQADLERSLNLNDQDTATLYNLALALFINGELDNAIVRLEQALKLDPISAQIHGDLGWYYLESGQLEKAKNECTHTLTLQQKSIRAHQCLMDVALLHFDQKTARTHALEIINVLGGSEAEQNTVREQWRLIQEKAFYEWYISFLNKRGIGWHSLPLARIYAKTGNKDEALNIIQSAKQNKHPVFMLMSRVRELEGLIQQM